MPIDPTVLVSAGRARGLGLCDECFGRLFGRLGHGLSNPQRAIQIDEAMAMGPRERANPCPLCGDLFQRLGQWVDRALKASDGIEWNRFACGSRWDPERLAREETIWMTIGSSWGESARSAFNRELGKAIEARTGRPGGPDRPDIVLLADLPVGRVEPTIQPLYLRGRYRKLDRTLPQTRWPCRSCQGRGCERCHGTGKMYPTSVEELVGGPAVEAAQAEGTRFHGMGREDIDARMLGDGRPFVLELLRPRRRTLHAAQLRETIEAAAAGRVELPELELADPAAVAEVKESSPSKSYRVGVIGLAPVEKVKEALSVATLRAIAQRTPTRVAHRRSDRVRARRILAARLVEASEGRFTLELRAEAGTYIKEWIEGDAGRTEPSLSGLVGMPLTVDFLDVIQIHDREPNAW